MHRASVARPDFDHSHPDRARQSGREREVSIDIGSVRGKTVWRGKRDDEIGIPQSRWRRGLGGGTWLRTPVAVSSGRACVRPAAEQHYLLVAESSRAVEGVLALGRQPGRHVATHDHVANLRRPTGDFFVGTERERRRPVGTMAGRAAPFDERRDVTTEVRDRIGADALRDASRSGNEQRGDTSAGGDEPFHAEPGTTDSLSNRRRSRQFAIAWFVAARSGSSRTLRTITSQDST